LGVATNGIPAPAMTAANAAEMQLSLCGGGRLLYFDYLHSTPSRNTVMLDLNSGALHYDTYTPGITFHADEESPGTLHDIKMVAGGADATTAKLYSVLGSNDAGTAIACQVRTPSIDVGDPRMRKRFGDAGVEVNAAGATVAVVPGFDNHTVTLAATNLPTTSARVLTRIDFNSGEGQRAKNISLDLAWSATTNALPILYFWEPSWLDRPVGTILRATDYDGAGNPICKLVAGIYIEADTFGVTRSAVLRSEGGTIIGTFNSINHSGKSIVWYPVVPRVYAYELSLVGNDANEWDLYNFYPDYDNAPPLTTYLETKQTSHGADGFQLLNDGYLSLLSNATITLQVYVDGSVTPVVAVFVNESSNTGGARKKLYFRWPATKGKLFRYVITSGQPFRLYGRDCEVRIKQWGNGGFKSFNPFGVATVGESLGAAH